MFAGFNISSGIAIEAGYADLGKGQITANITYPTHATVNEEIKSQAFHIDLVGNMPLEPLPAMVLSFKLGAYSAHTKASVAGVNSSGYSLSTSKSADNQGTHFGFSAAYSFTKKDSVRLAWERFKQVGNEDSTGTGDIDMASLGLIHNF